MIEIRKAALADSRCLALLGRVTYIQSHKEYFKYKADLIEYCNTTFSVDKIEKGIKNPNNVYWLASVNQLPVGYAKLKLNAESAFLDSKNICRLQKIYVLDDFISMKIGYKLQNAVMKEAKEKQFEEIWLSTYYKNTRAISFYLKNGFRKIGAYKFKIGEIQYDLNSFSKGL